MITLQACAKINLGLQIIGKLPNGYHSIHSLFIPIHGLYDTLSFEQADSLQFSTNDSLEIPDEQNLVYKAAHSLQLHTECIKGAKIHLTKNIPTGAGLGGGSSDAASTLLGLCSLWNITLTKSELHELALSLGSDVPFFLYSKPAIVEGQGELINAITSTIQGTILLIFPNIHINTAWAYSLISCDNSIKATSFETILNDYNAGTIKGNAFFNDFEKALFIKHPELQTIKESLIINGASIALMSGSGSTIFGIFTSKEQALQASKALSEYKQCLTEL